MIGTNVSKVIAKRFAGGKMAGQFEKRGISIAAKTTQS